MDPAGHQRVAWFVAFEVQLVFDFSAFDRAFNILTFAFDINCLIAEAFLRFRVTRQFAFVTACQGCVAHFVTPLQLILA